MEKVFNLSLTSVLEVMEFKKQFSLFNTAENKM